ncbi:endo-1,4-beta-xylanase xylA, putative (macronuclear) [Tetrahymena thermophila SB210]|uniref:Endo-1,4-beta-xylanase xylA, putative n=1 Tax=Tetrahymena thermophila (strain SB210) TaxID=312017 RepID=Q23M71_TETTS|nr:endo-1,4-beta-xylanase xylA, putative [Tetrahymena thermophila SB210]EAR97642.2 endo-1,4-beta-xylanase xylA, putative [Tetrahymena thermophila SB210]|eukprot:XP_001017887.2 endo-1,4-beta-xylanase xylA, putative [Tetrahymena thermophila SB210]
MSLNTNQHNQIDNYQWQASQNSKKQNNNSMNESMKMTNGFEASLNQSNSIHRKQINQNIEKRSKQQANNKSEDENNQNVQNNANQSQNSINNNNNNNNKNVCWINNVSTLSSQEKQNRALQSFFSEQAPNLNNLSNAQQLSDCNQATNKFFQSQNRQETKLSEAGEDFMTQPFDYQQIGYENDQQQQVQSSYHNIGSNQLNNSKKLSTNVNAKIDTFGNEQNNIRDVNESSIQQNKTDIINQEVFVKSILNQLMSAAAMQNQHNMYNNTTIHSRQYSENTPFDVSLNTKVNNFEQQNNFLSHSNLNTKNNQQNLNNNSSNANNGFLNKTQINEFPNLIMEAAQSKNQHLYNLEEFKPKSTLKIVSPSASQLLPNLSGSHTNSFLAQNSLTSPTAASYNIENYLPQKKYLKTQSDELDISLSKQISQMSLNDKKNINMQELAQVLIQEFKNQYKVQASTNENITLKEQNPLQYLLIKQKQEKLSFVQLPSLNLQIKSSTKIVSDSQTQTDDFWSEEQGEVQNQKNKNRKQSYEIGGQYQINQMLLMQQQNQQFNQQNVNKLNIMGQSMVSRRSSLQNQNTIQQHPGFEYELESELLSEEIHFNHPNNFNQLNQQPLSMNTNNTQHNQMYIYKKGSMNTEQISIPTLSSPNILKAQNCFPANSIQSVQQKFDFRKKSNSNYEKQLLTSPQQDENQQKINSQPSQNKSLAIKNNKPPQHNSNLISGYQNGMNRNNKGQNVIDKETIESFQENRYNQDIQMSSLEAKQRQKLYELEIQQKQLEEEFLQKQGQYYNSNQDEEDEELENSKQYQMENNKQYEINKYNNQQPYQSKNIQIQQYLNQNHQNQRNIDQNMSDYQKSSTVQANQFNNFQQQNHHNEQQAEQNQQFYRNKQNFSESQKNYNNQEDNSLDMETIMKLERIPFPNISLSRKDSIITNSNYANLPSQQVNNSSYKNNNPDNSLIQQSGYLQNSFNNGPNSQNNSFVSLNIVHSKIPKGFTNSQLKPRSFSSSTNQNYQNSQQNMNYSYYNQPSGDYSDNKQNSNYSPNQKSENKQVKNQSEQTTGPEKKQTTFSFNHSDYLGDNNLNKMEVDEENLINQKNNLYEDQSQKLNYHQQNLLPENLTTFKTFGQTIKPTSSTLKLSQREALNSTQKEDDNLFSKKHPFYESNENPLNSPHQIKQNREFERKIIMIQSFFRYCYQYKRQLFYETMAKCLIHKKQVQQQTNREKKEFSQRTNYEVDRSSDSQYNKDSAVQQSSELFIDSMFTQSQRMNNQNIPKKPYQQTPKGEQLISKESQNQAQPSSRRSVFNQINQSSNIYNTSNNFADSKLSYDLTVSPTTERRVTSQRGSKKQLSPKSNRDYNQILESSQQALQQNKDLHSQLLNLKKQASSQEKSCSKQIEEESVNKSIMNKSNQNQINIYTDKSNQSDNKVESSQNSIKQEYRSINSVSHKSNYFTNQVNMPFTHINNIQNILDAVFNN